MRINHSHICTPLNSLPILYAVFNKVLYASALSEKNKASTVLQRQECIPVGCVPPASVAISGGGSQLGGGVCLREVCLGLSA